MASVALKSHLLRENMPIGPNVRALIWRLQRVFDKSGRDLTIFINCYLGKSAKFPSNQGITGCFI